MQTGVDATELERFLKLFPRKHIISLPRRLDRRARVEKQFDKWGVNFASLGFEYFPGLQFNDPAGFPSAGVRGCFESHLAVLTLAAESASPTLICEDDFYFMRSRRRQLASVVDAAKSRPWDILYVGHNSGAESATPGISAFAGPLTGLHCYAVKATTARRLSDYLRASLARPNGHPDGGQIHADGAVNDFRRKNPDITALIVNPAAVTQFPSRTDLGTEKWYDTVPVLRDVAELARQIKARRLE